MTQRTSAAIRTMSESECSTGGLTSEEIQMGTAHRISSRFDLVWAGDTRVRAGDTRMTSRERVRSGGREAVKGAALAVAVAVVSLLAVGWSSASAQQDPEPPATSAQEQGPTAPAASAQQDPEPPATSAQEQGPTAPAERRFRPVLERVVNGDLVMAGNSNLISAGGWRSGEVTVADADPDSTELCIIRGLGFPRACADNSSSARLDIPDGARIVAARLYVQTTVATDVGPLRVGLDGPGSQYTYTELGGATLGVRKVYEAAGSGREGEPLRQAVWDVTKYVRKRGAGWYTVADIVSERAAPFLPYASWAIVAAYEFDPSSVEEIATLPVAEQDRFAERAVSWYDGFTYLNEGALSVQVTGFDVPATGGVFAKTFHFVGHGELGRPDNLLFNGNPVGNNLTPGDARPPDGVVIGGNPSCNSTTDVMNDTVCVLGTPVATKRPGPRQYRASGDGRTRTSGSGVDLDVIRVPDRYLIPGSNTASLSVQVTGRDTLAPGMLAASVDLPRTAEPVSPDLPLVVPAPVDRSAVAALVASP
jgi:hypothetical protein